jgi:tetratricopeptide (TPR) repeat protein
LNVLQGYYDLTQAEQLKRAGKAREAMAYFNRALGYGVRGLYFIERGRNYHRLKQYRKALNDFNRAIEIWPQTAFYLNYRARTLSKLGRYDEAFRDWKLAVKLDPLDPDILLYVSYALRDRRFYDQALAALNNALHYGANNHYIWSARGRLYLYELNDPAKAVEDLRVANQLSPGETRYLYNYAVALYKSHDCRAVKALRNFMKTCRKGKPSCRSKNLTWARHTMKYLTTTGGCAR